MIAYCLRMSVGIPTKLVIMSLNSKSFSYPADKVSFAKFRDSQNRLQNTHTLPAFTRIEISKYECEMLIATAERLRLPVVNVKLISALYLQLGYNSKQKRYWNENDGCICQECLHPYKVDISLTDELWKTLAKDKNLLCGRCIIDKLERRGFAAYNLENTNEN